MSNIIIIYLFYLNILFIFLGMMMGNSGPMMGNSGPMVPQPFGMFGPPPVRPGMAPFGGRY